MSVTTGTHELSNGTEAKNAAQHRGPNVSRARRGFRGISPHSANLRKPSNGLIATNGRRPCAVRLSLFRAWGNPWQKAPQGSLGRKAGDRRTRHGTAQTGAQWGDEPASGRGGVHGHIALHLRSRQRARTDMGKLQLCQQMLRLGCNRTRQDARAGFRTLRGHHNTRHGLTLDRFQYTLAAPMPRGMRTLYEFVDECVTSPTPECVSTAARPKTGAFQ